MNTSSARTLFVIIIGYICFIQFLFMLNSSAKISVEIKPEPVVIVNSTEPAVIANTTEPLVTAKTTEPAVIEKTTEPVVIEKTTEPAVIANSTEPAVIANMTEPVVTAKTIEPVVTAKTIEPVVTAKTTESAVITNSTEPAVIAKTTEAAVTTKASEAALTAKTTEPIVTDKTTEPAVTANTTEPVVIAETTEPAVIAQTTKPAVIAKTTKPAVTAKTTKPTMTENTTEPAVNANTTEPIVTVNCTHYFSVVHTANHVGIGNQLFQYAAAYTLSKTLNLPLRIRLLKSVNPDRKFSKMFRDYILDQFNVPQNDIFIYNASQPTDKHFMIYESTIMSGKIPELRDLMMSDYFESEIFFSPYKTEIRKMFTQNIQTHNIEHWLRDIKNPQNISVAVHVRRGDLVTGGDKRALPISYQIRAMNWMRRFSDSISFYVFSDDTTYVKDQLGPIFNNTRFVSNSNISTLEEFYLMTQFSHFIIPSSTFSWWAAYLSNATNITVIAPYPRFLSGRYDRVYADKQKRQTKKKVYMDFPYPDSWLVLNAYDENAYQPVPFHPKNFIYPNFTEHEYPSCI